MKKLLYILFLCPFFSFAQEEWEYASSTNDNSIYYVKDVMQKKNSDNILFWVKIIKPDRTVKTKKGNILKKGNITMQQLEANCSEKTIQIKSITEYDSKGEVVFTEGDTFQMQPVVPESIGEGVLKKACSLIK